MALFKISRGNAADLWTSNASKAAKNGYAWFTQDDGRFYIDVKDATTAVLNDSRIPVSAYHALKTVISSKTYTNVVCSANDDPNGYLYFGKIHRTNYYDVWHVKYRLYFTVGGTDDGHSYHEVDYYGSKNTYYAYRTYNAIANTGIRPMYNHVLYTSTATGVSHNDHNGGLLGIRFYSSYNPATAANARTILVEIIEEDNCTVELLASMQKFANLNVTNHYQSRYELDGTTQGNTMSGDRNTTDSLYQANGANRTTISVADGGIGLHRYTLQMMNAAGNFTSIAAKTGSTSNTNDTGTDKTATTASLLIHGPILYMSNNSYIAAGSSGNVNGYTAVAMDFRYTSKCGTTLLVQQPVYLVGTPDSDSTFKLDATTWYTQALPTTADGKIYIYLGMAYANYCIYLTPYHPVFEFKNGELRQFTRKSTISVAEGGTGNTQTPSMLTKLDSTTAANPYGSAPRPGVTGTLGVANGGTGNTTGTATYATTTADTSNALYPLGVTSGATTTLKRDTSVTLSGAKFSPVTNNTGELGNSSHKFAQVYATNLYGTFTGNLVGNADTASILKYHAQLTTKEAVDTFHNSGTGIQAAKVSSIVMNDTDTWNSNDGMIIDIPWHATYGHQIYIDDSSYQIHHRFGRTKVVDSVNTMDWQPWVKALYTDSRTAVGTATQPIYIDANGKVIAGTALGASAYHADSFFALAGHNHDTVYLKLNGSNNMTADVNIIMGDTDKFVNFWYNTNKTAGASWRIGALGSGTNDANYFVIQSGTSTTSATTWNSVFRVGQNTYDIQIMGNLYPSVTNTKTLGTSSLKWANVYATTFTGDLSGNATSATEAKWLMNRGTNVTIADSSWAHGQKGRDGTNTSGGMVWKQKWTQSGLTYTPSGGSATALTDSGDIVYWLSQSPTSNNLWVNMAIDGYIYSHSGFKVLTQSAAYSEGIRFVNSSAVDKGSINTDTNGVLGIYGASKVALHPALNQSTDGIEITTTNMNPTKNQTISLGGTSNQWANVYSQTFTMTHKQNANDGFKVLYGSTIDFFLGVGTGNDNHGLYDNKAGKWILLANTTNNTWTFDGNIAWGNVTGKPATSIAWGAGTTSGPTLTVTAAGSSSSAVAIPSASISASGIVTTGAQTFKGNKTFGYMTRKGQDDSGNASRWVADTYLNNFAGTRVGEFWYDIGDATNITTGKYTWRQYSPQTTATTTTTGFHENYSLPAVTKGLTANVNYDILTSKNTSATSSSAISVTWNTETTIATINGTAVKIKIPANPNTNTDTLVKQTVKTDNVNYKLLATTSAAPSSGTAMEATYSANIFANPLTGAVSAVQHTWNVAGTNKAYAAYNSTDDSIDFIFV